MIVLLTFQSVDDAWEKIDHFASRFNAISDGFDHGEILGRDQCQKVVAECDELTRRMDSFMSRFEYEIKLFDVTSDYQLAAKAVEASTELLSLENELLTYRSRFI